MTDLINLNEAKRRQERETPPAGDAPQDIPAPAGTLSADDREALERLQEKTAEFVQEVFDWVRPLGHVHILTHLYDLQNTIKEKIK